MESLFGGSYTQQLLCHFSGFRKNHQIYLIQVTNYATTSPLSQRLEILKLNDLHTFNLLCFAFQCNQITSIGPFQNYFVPLTSVCNFYTRKASKGDMYVSSINTTLYGKITAKYTGTILWNNLNINIRLSPS